MDFFGNVQGVEVGNGNGSETDWREEMSGLEEVIARAWARAREEQEQEAKEGRKNSTAKSQAPHEEVVIPGRDLRKEKVQGPAKVEAGEAWGQRVLGLGSLVGCALLWSGVSWFESSR